MTTPADLASQSHSWLVTGAAGFIGSHLVEALLRRGQRVSGLDNLSTGDLANLADVRARVGEEAWARFHFQEGSVTDFETCRAACLGVDFVLHQAGFVSVPQSIEDPLWCNAVNVDGTLHMLAAARDAGCRRFVYASSSAVYGDDETMPKVEHRIGRPLSPYGASKRIDEIYAGVFWENFHTPGIGLRYFNVFGPRQNPEGGYAAVIPRWITALVRGEQCHIHGDGENTRDFCHIENIVQANLLAALTPNEAALGQAYNVGLGAQTSLRELYHAIAAHFPDPAVRGRSPVYGPARPGDIIHSSADISKIQRDLGFEPAVSVDAGLAETVAWYAARASAAP